MAVATLAVTEPYTEPPSPNTWASALFLPSCVPALPLIFTVSPAKVLSATSTSTRPAAEAVATEAPPLAKYASAALSLTALTAGLLTALMFSAAACRLELLPTRTALLPLSSAVATTPLIAAAPTAPPAACAVTELAFAALMLTLLSLLSAVSSFKDEFSMLTEVSLSLAACATITPAAIKPPLIPTEFIFVLPLSLAVILMSSPAKLLPVTSTLLLPEVLTRPYAALTPNTPPVPWYISSSVLPPLSVASAITGAFSEACCKLTPVLCSTFVIPIPAFNAALPTTPLPAVMLTASVSLALALIFFAAVSPESDTMTCIP